MNKISVKKLFGLFWVVLFSFAAGTVHGAEPAVNPELNRNVRAAIRKGAEFLVAKQMDNGAWIQHPAMTALSVAALQGLEDNLAPDKTGKAITAGLDFIVSFAQEDGSIFNVAAKDYPNYSTAIALIALVQVNREQDAKIIRAARNYLLGSQFSDEAADGDAFGGIGYGRRLRPDLSNMQWAMEALYLTDHLDREPLNNDPKAAEKADLAWDRALEFLKKCQNLPEANEAGWVASDPENRGGFVYMPGFSQAGEVEGNEDGQASLRSYGSMTYAGLKSMIYARLNPEDVRVKAAVDWVEKNYTFTENPGMGQAGLFYYLHTAARALSVMDSRNLLADREKLQRWRQDMISSILEKQQPDGSWVNGHGRWFESIPELVTAYSVLALRNALPELSAQIPPAK